jgi:hypothetical protein
VPLISGAGVPSVRTERCAMSRFALIASLLVTLATTAGAQNLTVYDDALQNGFSNYSYGGQAGDINFDSAVQVRSGLKSIAFIGRDFNAVSMAQPVSDLATATYPTLSFWIRGGSEGGQQLRIYLQHDDAIVVDAELDAFISGGAVAAGVWREVTVPFASLPYSGPFDRIDLQSDVAGLQGVLYIDDVVLVGGGGAAENVMQIEHGVTVGSMVSDRFTWRDASNRPRVAVLAHNDGQVGPTAGVYANRGGALREFRYQLPDDSTRIAGFTSYGNGGYGGFGYVVSHRGEGSAGGIGDDSPLGYSIPGSFQRLFEGRHHAIFRFTQLYPRHSSTTANPANTRYDVPVTIDWVFSTGRDHPLWAITYDLSGVPVNALNDDSRAPYGELLIDGQGLAKISGVAWGDRYKFSSTTDPVTLDSDWTWNVSNTVPWVKLWIDSTNASMGMVQTQTMTQQDAGGGRNPWYHDLTDFWGKTSAQGNAGGAYKMPWQGDWPYQANSFSISQASGSNNARLTWGTQYGFLGQQSYVVNDGVVNTAPGWPKKSYSLYVVLGTHTGDPVGAQLSQVETIQGVSLSATTGSVATSGAAGVNRIDSVALSPAGYDHVYGALTFVANGSNELVANLGVAAGTLNRPLIIVRNYTGGYPVVKLGGVTLTADVAFFASLRPATSELWLTLNSNLAGPTNALEISSGGAGPPFISASGPTTFCQGGSVTLTASTAAGAGVSYAWSPTGETTRSIVVGASGSYSVTVTVNGTPQTSAPVNVTVNTKPATPSITAPASALAGQSGLAASVAAHGGATYSWSVSGGTITAGQGTSAITFTAGGAGTLVLEVVETSGAGCSSATATRNVTVTAGANSGKFFTATPCRIFDTRLSGGPAAGAPALAGESGRTFAVIGKCGVPATARAVSVNVTITGPGAQGHLTLFPADENTPLASTINFRVGQTRANNAIIRLAADGTGVRVVNGAPAAVHVILDVNGWFE